MNMINRLAAGVSLCVVVARAEPVTLEYRFSKGQTRSYEVTTLLQKRTELGARIANPITTVTTEQKITFDQRVDSVTTEGIATLSLMFRGAAVRVKSSGIPQSDAEIQKQAQAMLQPMVGKSISVTVNPWGEIQRLTGVDPIQKAITDTQLDPMDKESARQQFDSYFFSQLHYAVMPILTEDALVAGEKWPLIDHIPMPYENKKLVRAVYYTLASLEDGLATIDINGKLTLHTRTGEPEEDKKPSVLQLTHGEIKGSAIFDFKRGCFRQVRSQMDVGLQAALANPAQPQQRIVGITYTRTTMEALLLQ